MWVTNETFVISTRSLGAHKSKHLSRLNHVSIFGGDESDKWCEVKLIFERNLIKRFCLFLNQSRLCLNPSCQCCNQKKEDEAIFRRGKAINCLKQTRNNLLTSLSIWLRHPLVKSWSFILQIFVPFNSWKLKVSNIYSLSRSPRNTPTELKE